MRSKRCIGFVALLAALTLRAQEPGTVNNERTGIYDTLLATFNWPVDDAYRRVQGTNYDLHTLFNWQRLPPALQQAVPRPAPEWNTYELRVVSVSPDGLVASPISIDSVPFVGTVVEGVYFLTNYPGSAATAVDQVIRVTAKRCGAYASEGSAATLKLLDYGQPQPFPPRPPEPYDSEPAATESLRLVAREMEQADLGLAPFQYRVGIRYLLGDGVIQDIERARSFFQLAADQGHPDAANRLKTLAAAESPKAEPPPATPPANEPIVVPVNPGPVIGPVAPAEPVAPTPEPTTTPTP